MGHKLTVLDLFSGCGGLSTGFQEAGLRVIAASDHDKAAAATYKRNHPGVEFIRGDITDPRVRAKIVKAAKGVDVVAAGIPCQAYSTAGSRDQHDHRAWLWWPFLAVVKKLNPRWVVVENVKGIQSMQAGKVNVLTLLEHEFDRLGYRMKQDLLNAVHHGVAQDRKRVFILAARDGVQMPDFPKPLPGKPVSVKQAINDLADKKDNIDLSHVRANHNPGIVERFRSTAHGKEASISGHHAGFWKVHPDRPARTVTTSRSQFVHYSRPRTLTVREMARLQGFGDEFLFTGSTPEVLAQVGNAVPPALAKAVALEVARTAQEKGVGRLFPRQPLAKLSEWDRALVEVNRHVALFRKLDEEARSKRLQATEEALKIGRILEKVVFKGERRGKRGEGLLRKFCADAEIAETTAKECHRVYRAARTLGRLNRYPTVTRKYWIELANFTAEDDLVSWLAVGTLLKWPLVDEDGQPDHVKLVTAWKAFKNIRHRLSDHPFNIPIEDDEVYQAEGLEVFVKSQVLPRPHDHVLIQDRSHAVPIRDPDVLGNEVLNEYYYPGDRVEIHCSGDWEPSTWRKALDRWRRETGDWERTVSALVEGEKPSEEQKERNPFRRYWLVHPPQSIYDEVPDDLLAHTYSYWRETRTVLDVKAHEDRTIAAKTVAGWRRLAATLTDDEDRRQLDRLVRIEHSRFQDFDPGQKCWCIATDTPYNKRFLEAESVALGKFCKRWLHDRGAAVLMCGSDYLDIALKGLTAPGGLIYRWMLGYVLPRPMGHAEKYRFPLVTAHKVKPVMLLAASRNKPRIQVADYIEAGPMDEALEELKNVFEHAQDVQGWRAIVGRYCPVDETVLDPCTGIGTTAIACLRENRKFIGCDKSKEAVGLAKLRVEAEYATMLREQRAKSEGSSRPQRKHHAKAKA